MQRIAVLLRCYLQPSRQRDAISICLIRAKNELATCVVWASGRSVSFSAFLSSVDTTISLRLLNWNRCHVETIADAHFRDYTCHEFHVRRHSCCVQLCSTNTAFSDKNVAFIVVLCCRAFHLNSIQFKLRECCDVAPSTDCPVKCCVHRSKKVAANKSFC